MPATAHLHPSDLHGLSRLAIEGVSGTTALVEQLHLAIARVSGPTWPSPDGRTRGITGLVYRSIQGVTGVVGGGLDLAFRQLVPRLPGSASTPQRDRLLSVLNGVLGDHLEASGNPLALPMQLRPDRASPAATRAAARTGRKIAVFIHGLCMSDHHWSRPDGRGLPGLVLAEAGYRPLQLVYNSGRRIGHNGRDLAALLEGLVQAQSDPVDELVLIGHSMGGLVARSALAQAHLAGHAWTQRVTRLITLGSPHHGAPLERIGHQVERALALTPFSRPFSKLGRIRSAGITDLRHACLLDTTPTGGLDPAQPDPAQPEPAQPSPSVELPARLRLFAIAGSLAERAGSLKSRTLGDGLVPVGSALGQGLPAQQRPGPEQRLLLTRTGHLDLLHHPEVGAQILTWLRQP